MNLYTIGFTKKSAEEFFTILKQNNIKKVLDIRLNNSSQLAGFTKGNDLIYFLETICEIKYEHNVQLAPTKEILSDYKKKIISWNEYESQFIELLNKRNLENKILSKYVDGVEGICLLCSESTAENCHRRLVAEYIKNNLHDYDIEIIHL